MFIEPKKLPVILSEATTHGCWFKTVDRRGVERPPQTVFVWQRVSRESGVLAAKITKTVTG
jgi:hypothetical protein